MNVDAITSLQPHAMIDQAASRPDALQGVADRFNQLMAQSPPQHTTEMKLGEGSPMSHFIGAQESVMRQTFDEVRSFSMQAPGMNAQDLASRHIELTYQLAMVQVQFNAGVYISQSSKNGLQTLMKNQ